MKAIQVQQLGGPEVLKFVTSLPKPKAGKGQLVIKNKFIGVNYIDTYHRTGLYPMPLPFIPGREASGVVEEVGEGVTDFKVGDRVAFLSPGSYAEFTQVNASHTTHIPPEISMETAGGCLLIGMTALMLAKHAVSVKKGDTVLIHAVAGGTGQVLCQVCKALGARVIGTVSTEEKAEIAKKIGADEVILYTKQNVVEEVKRLTDGKGVRIVYDGVGKSTFDDSLASLAKRGVLVSFGNASGKPEPFDVLRLSKGGSLSLVRPTLFDYIATPEDFKELSIDLLENYLKFELIHIDIFKVYPLEKALESHQDLEGRKTTGKLILKVD